MEIIYQEVDAYGKPVGEEDINRPPVPVYITSVDIGCLECGDDTHIYFERA